jgi:hypothetical protein
MTKPNRYARDQDYGHPPRWGVLYNRHFPNHTCPASRHVEMLAIELRCIRSPIRRMMIDAKIPPDHWALSMERTVIALWQARARIIAELEGKNG